MTFHILEAFGSQVLRQHSKIIRNIQKVNKNTILVYIHLSIIYY